jgi:magnesium chelatase family protein
MSLAKTHSVTLSGLTAHLVTVEADIGEGLPKFVWTGLPDAGVRESVGRIKTAVANSGVKWPNRLITVGLSPASVRKTGTGFDLAVSLAILAAAGKVEPELIRDLVVLGELGLDGRVQDVTGVLPAVIGAVQAGFERVVVPWTNAREAALVPGASVIAVSSLHELCGYLRGEMPDLPSLPPDRHLVVAPPPPLDLADVVGQQGARDALEVAAAGGHHLFLTGPPGVGKTMLAERLPGLLPDLSIDAAMDVTSIHSLLGRLSPGQPLIERPPFCAPHHSATLASLVGGGSGIPAPGLISLAHCGVLFLDEATEFDRKALDALRQPIESGLVTISRAGGVATYPSRFQLVVAANPCPCSRGGRAADAGACICTTTQLRSYRRKISGPLLDRIDVRATLEPVSRAILDADAAGEPTAVVRDRVIAARERSGHRLAETPWTTNSQVPGPVLRRKFRVPAAAMRPLAADLDHDRLSTRGVDRVLKVAWTIADLAGHDIPTVGDVERARAFRFGTTPRTAAAA